MAERRDTGTWPIFGSTPREHAPMAGRSDVGVSPVPGSTR
jgi:hypothetical protein